MMTDRTKLTFAALLLLLLFAGSFFRMRDGRACTEPSPTAFSHRNGLELLASSSQFTVTETEQGFEVEPVSETSRHSSHRTAFELRPAAPLGSFRQSRMVGGRRVYYRYAKMSERSLPTVRLQAFSLVDGKVLAVDATVSDQTVTEGDFAATWCLLNHANIRDH